MAVLSNLEPKRVFEIFESLASIPHGSRNTKAISDWCVKFGEERGLECHQDAANNVILIAPATPGYENAPAVILQGHLDMVCEKDPRIILSLLLCFFIVIQSVIASMKKKAK